MAFKCGFFNAINSDRKYNADDMMNPIKGIVSEGVIADDKKSDGLQVVATTGLKLLVKRGRGIFFGKWCDNDADMEFTVPIPHVTETRVDSIIVRIDISDNVRAGSIIYKQGINNQEPSLENTSTAKEYRLANITVAPNAQVITQANIQDTRPTSECGFVSNLLQNSDITATYSQWQAQFEEWFNSHKNAANEQSAEQEYVFDDKMNKINTKMSEKEIAFDEWFQNVKETLSTNTLIRSFTSRYITEEQDETIIPIQIKEYQSVLDILQVYISGLICFEGVDYEIDGFNNIILKNGVDKGTELTFVVYKSMDGTGIDKFIEDVDDLIARQDKVESDFTALETRFESAETDITTTSNDLQTTKTNVSNLTTKVNTATTNISNLTTKVNKNVNDITALDTRIDKLEIDTSKVIWNGGNVMGSGASITPSKKLSECKNGYILAWCGWNGSNSTNTRFNFVQVSKNVLASIPGNDIPLYCNLVSSIYESGKIDYAAKRVDVYDDRIEGFVGNTATDLNNGMCLRFVLEY